MHDGDRRSRLSGKALASRLRLETKNKPKAVLDILQKLASDSTGGFDQKVTIDGNDLRYIGHRVLRQAGRPGWQQHVAWSVNQTCVRAQHDANDGVNATPIERVALHDKDRPLVSWLGAVGLSKIGPPDLAALDYHGSGVSDLPCKRLTAAGNRLSTAP